MSWPFFTYNVSVSATSVRCPSCGKRLSPSTRVCPICGAEQALHIRRIRCNYCNRRVPTDIMLCPYCKHDPRGVYLRPRLLLGAIFVVAIAALAYTTLNSSAWVVALAPGSTPTPTATAVPTRAITLLVVATTAPSATPTPTLRPAAKPTATAPLPTDTPTPTATRRVVIPPPVRTVAPAPTGSTSLAPPMLLAPVNGAKLNGSKRNIVLLFQSGVALQPDEWFRIEVVFKDREDRFANWCGWTKDSSIQFPWGYYEDSWQQDRSFHWHVSITQSLTDMPSTCAASVTEISPPSPDWTFYWY